MSSSLDEYIYLIEQIQLQLMEMHKVHSWIDVSRESYWHYRTYAASLPKTPKKQEVSHESQKVSEQKIEAVEKTSPTPTLISEEKVQKVQIESPVEKPKQVSKAPLPIVEDLKKNSSLLLDPLVPKEIDQFADLRKLISERFPEQVILPQPLDDTLAQAIKMSWKNRMPSLYLVVSDKQSRHFSLLANICKAIKIVYNIKAEVIEKNLLMAESTVPFIELGDLDEYLNQPHLKARLWKVISEKIKL